MRWLLVVLAALTLEGCSEAEASAYRCRFSRLGRETGCDPRPSTATGPSPYSFCDSALTAGNRTGTWGCINGDGSAPSGDNLGPWVVSGSPSSTSGTTCAAPSYKTFNGATPDYVISTAGIGAVPSAFTFCGVYQLSSNTVFSAFAWQTSLGGAYTLTTEQSAVLIFYPNGGSNFSSLSTIGTGEKALICYSYSGGTQYIYIKSPSGSFDKYASAATAAPTLAGGTQKVLWGADAASYNLTGNFYGGFYTEKLLDQTALDAIYDAVIGAGCT